MQTLFTPAHLHLAINHVPIIGLAVACLSVFLGIVFHSRGALASGLVAVLLCVGTLPVIMETGEAARESFVDGTIDPGMDATGNAAFKEHAHRAAATAPVIYAVGILALLALLFLIKFPRQAAWIGWAVLLGSAIGIGLSVWTAEAGGRIRHTEFRSLQDTIVVPTPIMIPVPAPSPAPSPTPSPSITPEAKPMPSPELSPSPSPSPALSTPFQVTPAVSPAGTNVQKL